MFKALKASEAWLYHLVVDLRTVSASKFEEPLWQAGCMHGKLIFLLVPPLRRLLLRAARGLDFLATPRAFRNGMAYLMKRVLSQAQVWPLTLDVLLELGQ